MSTHDIDGKEWARFDKLRAGNIVQTDGGSPCWKKHRNYKVHLSQEHNEFYIKCKDHYHALDVQLNEAGTHYIGIYFVS